MEIKCILSFAKNQKKELKKKIIQHIQILIFFQLLTKQRDKAIP